MNNEGKIRLLLTQLLEIERSIREWMLMMQPKGGFPRRLISDRILRHLVAQRRARMDSLSQYGICVRKAKRSGWKLVH